MSQIRALYEKEPAFPPTDQHPDAERFAVSVGIFRYCDAVGGAPTQADVDAFLGIDASGLAKKARLEADAAEEQQAKIDVQIQADLNMTPQEVGDAVDTIFDSWTMPQRIFMKRLVRMVLAAARKVLR